MSKCHIEKEDFINLNALNVENKTKKQKKHYLCIVSHLKDTKNIIYGLHENDWETVYNIHLYVNNNHEA